MEQNANLASVATPDEDRSAVGHINLNAEDGSFTLMVESIGYDASRDGTVMAMSAVGTGTEVRAWRAALTSNQKLSATLTMVETNSSRNVPLDAKDGYKVKTLLLGFNTWHLVAISRRVGFLPNVSEEGVWQHLHKYTTTPIHRSWMPWILRLMEKKRYLRSIYSVGFIHCGEVDIDDSNLDELVAAGLKSGQIGIPA
jgi:hypothetical protein